MDQYDQRRLEALAKRKSEGEGMEMDEAEAREFLVSYQNSGRRRSSILRQLMSTNPSLRSEIAELKEEHLSTLVSVENLYGNELTQLNAKRRAELTEVKAAYAVQHAMMQAQVQCAQEEVRRLSLGVRRAETIPEVAGEGGEGGATGGTEQTAKKDRGSTNS